MDHPNRRRVVALLLLLACVHGATGQTLKPGPQVLTIFSDVDDTEQPYGLYLPKNFNPKKKYPLVVMLHGAGSNHRLSLRRVFGKSNQQGETDVEATRYFPEWKDVDFIVASPYARGTVGYQGIAERDVLDVLADVKRRFPIDEDRVYLTGLSMGGGGTLWIGLTRPDIWAAIAPVCPAPPEGTLELAPNALNYPVHFFQGGADPVVKPEGTREWVKRLEALGTRVEYTEYPGVQHNSWENAYKDEAIFDWFKPFRRNRYPDRVRFATSRYKYTSAYWVAIDQLTPGTLASVDARFTSPNHLEITTAAVGALTLKLAGHPKFKANQPLEVLINGKQVRARVASELSLTEQQNDWVTAKYEPEATAKRAGSEGPISEVIGSRHIYVYGTADSPTDAERQKRREQAEYAANWSVYRNAFLGRVMIFPRVLADKEVRPSDLESANLVLFGTKESNSLVAKYSDRLPVQFNAAASTNYGLVYVFPAAGHYVLVSSGLPWWAGMTGPAPRNRRNPFGIGAPDLLLGMKDYLLFKGTIDTPVAEGRFDGSWRMPDGDAARMTASGAVTLNGRQ
ncbi:MAG TPA: alpha/beta hydrolase-fold protein [Blastocatellia bacterium]|nr:alpha/beta hydrolase-fold protein [Blastocatellia bacterium]